MRQGLCNCFMEMLCVQCIDDRKNVLTGCEKTVDQYSKSEIKNVDRAGQGITVSAEVL